MRTKNTGRIEHVAATAENTPIGARVWVFIESDLAGTVVDTCTDKRFRMVRWDRSGSTTEIAIRHLTVQRMVHGAW